MKKDNYSFIALLEYADDGISITFPDLPGCISCAYNTDEAIKNAKEALGLHIWGMEQDSEPIPQPTPLDKLHLEPNSIPLMVDVFMPPVRDRINNRSVNRTVTLPAWLNAAALEVNTNFSQVLQDALKEKLNIHHAI
jgi:predicted RNase H-like HicB family nuclease